MIEKARTWLAALGGSTVGIAGIVCVASPQAGAEPAPVPAPSPVTVTQTVTVAPQAGAVQQPGMQTLVAPQAASVPMATVPMATVSAGPPAATVTQQAAVAPASPTAAAPAAPALVPATSGTITDYLKSKNVKLEPQKAQGFQALNITLPMPPGWTQVPDPNVPDAFGVIANRNSPDLYTPNAQLVVYRLVGDFDPKEAITHGFVDSQSLPAWRTTAASLTDYCGFPSSIIEGTYRQNDMTLNTSRRHVIATSGPDRYLVSLSVTSVATTQGVTPVADATDAIVNGFRVASASPAAPAPAPPVHTP